MLLLLLGCYDKVEIVAHLDLRTDRVVGESRELNVWRRAITCTDTPTCLEAIRTEVSNQAAAMREQGALDVVGGAQVRDGELDFVWHWSVPLKAATYANQTFLLLYEQPGRGNVWMGRARPHLGFVWQEERGTRVSVEKAPFGSRVWTLPDEPTRNALVMPGSTADLAITFTTLDDVGNPAHEAGWIGAFLGLEEALRAEAPVTSSSPAPSTPVD